VEVGLKSGAHPREMGMLLECLVDAGNPREVVVDLRIRERRLPEHELVGGLAVLGDQNRPAARQLHEHAVGRTPASTVQQRLRQSSAS
jgi:hypothetical protein